MPKKTKTPPTFHRIPDAFIQAAESYLPSAILESDRPLAKVFTAAKQGKEVARGLISRSIDEIQVLEEKRKFKLMMSGDLDPAPDAIALELIAMLKLAFVGDSAAVAVETTSPTSAAAVEIAPTPTVASPDPKTAIAAELGTGKSVAKIKRVLPNPAPNPAAEIGIESEPTAAPGLEPAAQKTFKNRKILAVPTGAVLKPEIPLAIGADATFRQFMWLRVPGGHDNYSAMNLHRLIAALGDKADDTRQQIKVLWQQRNDIDSDEYQQRFNNKVLARVLRWHLRGLSIDAAVKKARIDYLTFQGIAAKKQAA
jgi:hypothetical protein